LTDELDRAVVGRLAAERDDVLGDRGGVALGLDRAFVAGGGARSPESHVRSCRKLRHC
jgi:hypothetical protein